MAVTVPSTDIVNYALQAQIAAVQTLVTAAAASNPAQFLEYTQQLARLQQQLVYNLMANGSADAPARGGPGNMAMGPGSYLTASGILSNSTINT
jgi:hypothetical protein